MNESAESADGWFCVQDGSCNGLQHYAALGRDQAGAESVNVAPAAAPRDVYSDVVALVEAERRRDAAAEGSEHAEIARLLEGVVERKVSEAVNDKCRSHEQPGTN